MESTYNKPTVETCPKIYSSQPVSCPWSSVQPYPNATSKIDLDPSTSNKNNEKSCSSIQQSSSHFFYFLRLMQLFPEAHPATIHTVLCLCKNNFFHAVDKLLYARKCKTIYNQKQANYRRGPYDRSQSLGGYNENNKYWRDEVLDLKIQPGTSRTFSTPRINTSTCRTSESAVKGGENTPKVVKCTCKKNVGESKSHQLVDEPSRNSNENSSDFKMVVPKTETKTASSKQLEVYNITSSDPPVDTSESSSGFAGEDAQTGTVQENAEMSLQSQSIIQSDIIILQ